MYQILPSIWTAITFTLTDTMSTEMTRNSNVHVCDKIEIMDEIDIRKDPTTKIKSDVILAIKKIRHFFS